jgi:hypothetical protein
VTTQTDAFGRLRAFLADWGARWQEAWDEGAPPEQWAAVLDGLQQRHFVEGANTARPAIGAEPLHSPRERVVDSKIGEVEARFQTTHANQFHEYRLVHVGGDWRIENAETFAGSPEPLEGSPPLVSEKDRDALLSKPTLEAALSPLPADYRINGDRAFTLGLRLDGTTSIEVHRVGVLALASGVVGVQDLTHECLPPLVRRVPPGQYPIEVAFARNRHPAARRPVTNVAMRMRVGPERPTVRWHPATNTEGDDGGISSDAANVGIFDLTALTQLSRHAHAELAKRLPQGPDSEALSIARMLKLVVDDDCVAAESGFGDGTFPCYWGTDADGELTTLQIDFIRVPEAPVAKPAAGTGPTAAGARPGAQPGGGAMGPGITIDPKLLLRTLNPTCTSALEVAAASCIRATHYQVTVEHLLLALLELPRTDVGAVLDYFRVDVTVLRSELEGALGKMRTGNKGKPVFSTMVFSLIQTAWKWASTELGDGSVRSGALLRCLVQSPHWYLPFELPALGKIADDVLRKELRKICGPSEVLPEGARTKPAPTNRLKFLLNKLNRTSMRAIQGAAALCVDSKSYEVTIEHVLLKLVEDGESDVAKALDHFEVDGSAVRAELRRVSGQMRTGNAGKPVFSQRLFELFEEAWAYASTVLHETSIRSGALLVCALHSRSRSAPALAIDELPTLRKIPPEVLRKDLREVCAGSAEAPVQN